ncbi:MAG: hypothetical protein KDC87_13985 [Planctomycetes bacterium]|nr:hypothetical protein [Planctomycetota bacterium]MCB9872462.1 hypothetical protein [Planctomycetota bacterium]
MRSNHPILAAALALASAGAAQPAAKATFPWLTNLENAEQLATRTGKPLLLVFR